MKSTIRISLSIIALAFIASVLYLYSYSTVHIAHATSGVAVYIPETTGSTLCGNASSTLVMATSTSGRNLGYISNDSGTAIWLGLGTAASPDKGVLMSASSTIKFDSSGSYGGAIYCTAKGVTASSSWADSNG